MTRVQYLHLVAEVANGAELRMQDREAQLLRSGDVVMMPGGSLAHVESVTLSEHGAGPARWRATLELAGLHGPCGNYPARSAELVCVVLGVKQGRS